MITFGEDSSDFLTPGSEVHHFLVGGGEVASLMRAFTWQTSPMGSPFGWPLELKTLVGMMLAAEQPMFIAWGAERTMLYNDAYTKLIGSKHPGALASRRPRSLPKLGATWNLFFKKYLLANPFVWMTLR